MKTEQQMQDMADKASNIINTGTSKFSGMTYEEGVRAALEWAMESTDGEEPLE